jgi:serine/threonine-protein kinase
MTDGPDTNEFNPTTVLGDRYELGEVIGRGGMAEVHRGRDLRLGRLVAIKSLRVDLVTDETFQARFRREAQSSAALNHPNIVAVYDTGESEINGVSVPYIVMEYVDGKTLREMLREEPSISTDVALEVTAEILTALDYSHRAGIVHRDIKPGNVMITEAGQVKVMDFGIARAMGEAGQTMTQTSMVVGTAQYLSPEQARGETADARSDLYATGCVLYELLTGRPPFVGDSLVSVAMAHVKEPPVPPSTLNPSVPAEVDAIVLMALAKDRLQRYQSAAEMRADIDRFRAGHPVAAVVAPETAVIASEPTPTSLVPGLVETEPPPRSGSGRTWLVVLAVLLVLGLAALAGFALFRPSAEQVRVPNLVGSTVDQATGLLAERGLALGETTQRADADAPEGTVLEQDPAADVLVDPSTAVDVVVSAGPETTLVPQIVGIEIAQARPLIADAELVLGTVTPQSSDQPEGVVLAVDPPEGSEVAVGTTVNVTVSSGTTTVPDVVGLPSGEAQAVLAQAGFDVRVTEQTTSDSPAGTVVFQAPPAGTEVTAGTRVAITVAVAPAPTPAPTPTTPATPAATPAP